MPRYQTRRRNVNTIATSPVLLQPAGPQAKAPLSEVNFKMVSVRSEKPVSAPHRLPAKASPLKQSQCLSDCRWPFLVLSKKILERFLFLRFSPAGDRWWDVLRFAPSGSLKLLNMSALLRLVLYLCWLQEGRLTPDLMHGIGWRSGGGGGGGGGCPRDVFVSKWVVNPTNLTVSAKTYCDVPVIFLFVKVAP